MNAALTIILAAGSSLVLAEEPKTTTGSYIQGAEDFGCTAGPNKETWVSVKSKIRDLFQKNATVLVRKDKTLLNDTFTAVYAQLKDNNALNTKDEGECSLGRLSFQLLALTYAEPEVLLQLFSSFEKIASPVLTSLLDVPWLALAQSGWPLFAILAEINLQKIHAGVMNKDVVDGLDQPIGQAFYNEFMDAVVKGDGAAIGKVTNLYLSLPDDTRNAYASLAAIVGGAASSDVKQRMQLMDIFQTGLKQVITNALELDVSLGTQWRFWGLTHMSVDVFAEL